MHESTPTQHRATPQHTKYCMHTNTPSVTGIPRSSMKASMISSICLTGVKYFCGGTSDPDSITGRGRVARNGRNVSKAEGIENTLPLWQWCSMMSTSTHAHTTFSRVFLFGVHTVTSFFLLSWLPLDMRRELGRSTWVFRKIIWWRKSNPVIPHHHFAYFLTYYVKLHVGVHLCVCNGRPVEAIWNLVKHWLISWLSCLEAATECACHSASYR